MLDAFQKPVKNNNGSTLVELVMVMTILVLFGVTIYTMIYSGANTQERIISEKEAQSDARVAISYINVRLRQNDSAGKLAVEMNELTGKNAILIRERGFEAEYDTWIFCYDGQIMECLVDPGAPPTVEGSFSIVNSEGLDVELNPETGSITNTLYYQYNNTVKSISSTVNIRSYGGADSV